MNRFDTIDLYFLNHSIFKTSKIISHYISNYILDNLLTSRGYYIYYTLERYVMIKIMIRLNRYNNIIYICKLFYVFMARVIWSTSEEDVSR